MDHPLRLMTWNVRSLRDDRDAVVGVLRRAAPDVLFVQEAPRFLRARSKLAALARESDLVVVCGGRPAAGVAILSSLRMSVETVHEVKLPKSKDLHQRGVAIADLALLDVQFTAAAIHLGLNSEERQRHASQIQSLIGPAPHSVVGGDLNESDAGTTWKHFADHGADAGAESHLATYPSSSPTKRIDTIFVPHIWKTRTVSLTEIADDATLIRATDHRPVTVDVMGWR